MTAKATAAATGTFSVSAWDESTYAELGDGAKLTRATVEFGFAGDLTGQGSWEVLMCYRPDGTASYTGLQLTKGSLAGRDGSFVLRADGTYHGGTATTSWQVIEGSATGRLAGLAGSGQTVSSGPGGGTYSFDYELG